DAPSQLRLIHYPYNPEVQDAEGIGAHTDYECFTLLLPTAPGLQVLNKTGEWIDIPLIENTLVMNIGDMMEILSNGKYLA
ncbi:isopenicillin N synthase family oxygenase, partial [Klebsiella pneumoniae]|nr:isopenicillin N synthase family oxygenase [Klebsiella pneumoniae]